MKKDKLDMIGYVDGQLIEKADQYTVAGKKSGWRMGLAIAACLCLIVGSVTVLATTGLGTKLIDSFTARREAGSDFKESGFDLSVAIDRIPTEVLSEETQNIGKIIRQQFQDQSPYDNRYPGEWSDDFASRDEACAFLGLKPIKKPDCGWEEQATTLRVYGNEQGEILRVDLETDYAVDGVRMQFFTQVFTENSGEETITAYRTTEDVVFTESRFTTNNRISCHVITSSAMESGYLGMDGYIVDNGILYNLHVSYSEKDANQATAFLHQWADMF